MTAQASERPAFEVHPNESGAAIIVKYWPAAGSLTVTLDDPATVESPDYLTRGVAVETEEGYGGGVDVDKVVRPGDVITVTDGITTKSQTVLDIRVTSFDFDADRVYGTVDMPNSAVTVYAYSGADRWVTADSRGNWMADFSVSTDPREPPLDIVKGTQGGVEQVDVDGDSTVLDWVAPTPTSVPARTSVPSPAAGVNGRLGLPGRVTGLVTDGTRPIADIAVEADTWTVSGWVPSSSARTASDGTYALTGLTPGRYRIWFQDPGGRFLPEAYDGTSLLTPTPVNVAPGATAGGIDAALEISEPPASSPNALRVGGSSFNPTTGHFYAQVSNLTWLEAEAYAVRLGGHLVAINDQAEEEWLLATFNSHGLCIGLNDRESEGTWVWSSGDPVTYTNWAPNQPDNFTGTDARGEDLAAIWWDGTFLSGWADDSSCRGALVELPARPATGWISGTVTADDATLAGIQVDALAQEPGADRWAIVGSATTDVSGEYTIGDLPPADYRIAFQGGATFADQYWPDQRDPDTAKTVSVTAGGVLSSINAGLVSDFRDAGQLVPMITTFIPTPADTSREPPVVGANLLLAALAMVVFTVATELLNRSLGQLDPTLRRRFRPIDGIDRARAQLDTALIGRFGGAGHARRADALRILGIAAFYGIVFALLDPTWNPFSVTGLWLVLIMAVAFGLIGLSGDIAAWAMARRWGIAGDLAVKPGSLVTAIGSTLFTRVLVLVPGVMIGSPEALEVDAERLDRRRLGGLAGVGLGTVLAIGLVAWLGTLVTTALRGSGEVVDDLMGGVEAFLLLVFAAAVQNGFVQLLSLRESAGMALRRAYRIPWAIALLAVTFVFWHTLVNPRGDLAEALGSTNVQAFLVTVGIVFAAAVAVWTALAVVRRRGVRCTEVELVTSAAITPPLEVPVPAPMPFEAAVPGVDPPGPLVRDQPAGSTSPPASMAMAEGSPEPPPAGVPAGR